MQAHEQQGEGVDEAGRRVLAHRQGEQGAVGERELQVLGDQDRVEFLAVAPHPSRDDRDRVDGGCVQAREVAQDVVLVVCDRLTDLLDRQDAAGQVHEPHDVAGNAAGERCEQGRRPLLQWNIPGEVEERGVDRGSRNVQSHIPIVSFSDRHD